MNLKDAKFFMTNLLKLIFVTRVCESVLVLAISFFVVFLFMQHNMVFPYHDDWGLAVLDYVGEQTGFSGQNFNLSNVINFLSGMYQNWTGRVFAFFIQIYLFKFGIEYVRIFQIAVILAIIFFSIQLSSGRALVRPIVLVPITLFLSMPAFTVAGGLYWFSASSAYVWGLPLLLFAGYFIKKEKRLSLTSSILLACAAAFHEQISVAVIVFLFSYISLGQLSNWDSRLLARNFMLSSPVLVIGFLVILAPGNFKRKSESSYPASGLYDVITINAESLSGWVVRGRVFFVIMLFSLILLTILYLNHVKNKSYAKTKSTGFILVCLAVFFVLYFLSKPLLVFSFFIIYGLIIFLVRKKIDFGDMMFSIYISSIASLALLLLAPGVPPRSLLPFYFLMTVPITFSFVYATQEGYKKLIYLFTLVIFPFAFLNAKHIYDGYKENYQINLVNHYKLASTSYDLHHNVLVQNPITLYKLPHPQYAETMPYQRPLIEKWMKKYYSLPSDVTFIWK